MNGYPSRGLALALIIVGVSLLGGQAAQTNPLPLAGMATELAQFHDDLFVHLDTDEDSQGDLWVKLLADASIKDEDGNELSLDKIEVGSILIIVNYWPKDSFYEADQVILIVPKADDKPFAGDVIQIEKDQNALSVLLDTNGDQKGDTWLKISPDTTLKDGLGKEVSPDEIVVGAVVIVISFEPKESYLEVSEAVVLQPNSEKK